MDSHLKKVLNVDARFLGISLVRECFFIFLKPNKVSKNKEIEKYSFLKTGESTI